jgi:hypothetical protein
VSRIKLSLLLVGLLALCGVFAPVAARAQDVPNQAASMFVGRVEGTDAFIGLSTNGDAVFAYVCDGASAGIADFFSGTAGNASNGALALPADDTSDVLFLYTDAAGLLDAMASGKSLVGAFQTSDGAVHYFTAEPASGPGAIYRMNEPLLGGVQSEGGWVVLNDGEIRGFGGFTGMLPSGETFSVSLSMSAGLPGQPFLTTQPPGQPSIVPAGISLQTFLDKLQSGPPLPQHMPIAENVRVQFAQQLPTGGVFPGSNFCAFARFGC